MSDASKATECGHTLLALSESVEWARGCLIAFNAESRWPRWPGGPVAQWPSGSVAVRLQR